MAFTFSFLMVGVSYLLLPLLMMSEHTSFNSFIPFLLIAFSFPHFIATYALWISRVKDWKREWWPVLFPIFYVVIFILSIRGLFPVPVWMIIKCSYVYLIYHFCQQLYGVSLWMCGQKRIILRSWMRLLLRGIFLLTGLYALMEMEMRGATEILFYTSTPLVYFPAVMIEAAMYLLLSSVMIFIGTSFYDYFKTHRAGVFIPLLGIGSAFLWFIPPFSHHMVYYLPLAHGLQYYPFIYMKMRKLTLVKWGIFAGASVAFGWIIFRWIPFNLNVGDLSGVLWTSLVLTLLNNHHFVIDGRIWKLRDPENQDLRF